MKKDRTYIAIDLKSFYASVECAYRGLDPMTTNLVVADETRTPKTICLAVSPSLKAFGISGRARLFQVIQRVEDVNEGRRCAAPGRELTGGSVNADELAENPKLAVEFIAARPRMAAYIAESTKIYEIYLRYFAPESIHVYSVDEVFIDYTEYEQLYGCSARAFASRVIREVQDETGVPAVAGIGSNMYLAKVALDILAKHADPDEHGVRIAELDERSYREKLWDHEPLTDFWRVGRGIARKLKRHGMDTMGDVALCSVDNEEVLYGLFGKNAELLIDHAWGWEPCTIAEIQAYQPKGSSLGSGQVLREPYEADKARIVLREMADELALDLVRKKKCTDQIIIAIGYDAENLKDGRTTDYTGPVERDFYGRDVPKSSHASRNLGGFTASGQEIMRAAGELFDEKAVPGLTIRRLYITANHVMDEEEVQKNGPQARQLDMFTNYETVKEQTEKQKADREKERRLQETVLALRSRFGNAAVVRGMSLEEGATGLERGRQIGGHRA